MSVSVSVQYEHLHTVLYNPFFVVVFVVVGVRQCEHSICVHIAVDCTYSSPRLRTLVIIDIDIRGLGLDQCEHHITDQP